MTCGCDVSRRQAPAHAIDMPLLSAGVKLFDHLKDDGHRADNQGCLHNVADVVEEQKKSRSQEGLTCQALQTSWAPTFTWT